MEVVGGNWDSEFSQVAQEVPIGFDLLVTPRLAELHLERPIGIVDARKNSNSVAGKSLLGTAQILERCWFRAKFQARPTHPDLLQEEQIVICNVARVQSMRELGV